MTVLTLTHGEGSTLGATGAVDLADQRARELEASLNALGITRHLLLDLPDSAWGSETPARSCSEAVLLVDQPVEQVASPGIARVGRDRPPGRCER